MRAARAPTQPAAEISIGELVETLGERSFGWSIALFALVNMIPMPIGSNMLTALPLIMLSAQMALGLPKVRLPGIITRRRISRKGFQRLVLRLGPLIRPVERRLRQRHTYVFGPTMERALGGLLLIVALALFVPVPLSGYLPAIALFIAGVGLVERDGLVALGGAALGVAAVALTVGVAAAFFAGAHALGL